MEKNQRTRYWCRIVISLSSALMFACSSIKPYPVCYFSCSKPDIEARIEITQGLANYLKVISQKVVVHPNNRWILAKTNYFQHKKLKKIWPRVACIGNVTSGTEVSKNSECVEYISTFMKKKRYLEFDIDQNTVHSDEAPGTPHVICCCEFD